MVWMVGSMPPDSWINCFHSRPIPDSFHSPASTSSTHVSIHQSVAPALLDPPSLPAPRHTSPNPVQTTLTHVKSRKLYGINGLSANSKAILDKSSTICACLTISDQPRWSQNYQSYQNRSSWGSRPRELNLHRRNIDIVDKWHIVLCLEKIISHGHTVTILFLHQIIHRTIPAFTFCKQLPITSCKNGLAFINNLSPATKSPSIYTYPSLRNDSFLFSIHSAAPAKLYSVASNETKYRPRRGPQILLCIDVNIFTISNNATVPVLLPIVP